MTVLERLRRLIPLLRARLRPAREPLRYLGPVSVIVPAHNDAAGIAATVWSLVGNDYPGVEIIVCDDGSADGTPDIVEALGLPGVFVVRQVPAGRSAALATGIRYARHDLLVLVDAGTVVETDTIGRLVQWLRDPAVGAVTGTADSADCHGLLARWPHLADVIGSGPDRMGAFRRSVLPDEAAGADLEATVRDGRRADVSAPAAGYFDAARSWTGRRTAGRRPLRNQRAKPRPAGRTNTRWPGC